MRLNHELHRRCCESSVRGELSSFFDKKIKEKQIDTNKKNAMLALFDAQQSKDIAPAPNLRAAIVSLAGTIAEQSLVDAVAAPVLGVPTSNVPDVATLLFGPLARGAEVSVG